MSPKTTWFIAALIVLFFVGQGAPQIAGWIVVLVVIYLALQAVGKMQGSGTSGTF